MQLRAFPRGRFMSVAMIEGGGRSVVGAAPAELEQNSIPLETARSQAEAYTRSLQSSS